MVRQPHFHAPQHVQQQPDALPYLVSGFAQPRVAHCGDPIESALSASTIPFIRSQDLSTARALYATLTGRLSSVRAFNNLDEKTRQYQPYAPLTYRENFTTSGLYFQDSFRPLPRLTLNYGLRWEFVGAMDNTNNTYINPQYSQLLGPSTAEFQPGILNGTADPQLYQRSTTYNPSRINPAPNFGFAWNPTVRGGLLGKLLGGSRTVIRGGYGINFFDQGLRRIFGSIPMRGTGSNCCYSQAILASRLAV